MMAGNIAIDTSAVINLFRGSKFIADHLAEATQVCMPITTLGELYCGLLRCNNPTKERSRIDEMRQRCKVIDLDEDTAIHYAEIYSNLEKQGSLIPLNDIWIAAFAKRHGIPLIAHDDHFLRVTGLDLIAEPSP